MSAIQPDESLARRMHGLQPGEQPVARSTPLIPGTSDDGTLSEDPGKRAPCVLGDRSFEDVTNIVCGYAEAKMPKPWLAALTITSSIAALGTGMILYLIITGVGVWGLNNRPRYIYSNGIS